MKYKQETIILREENHLQEHLLKLINIGLIWVRMGTSMNLDMYESYTSPSQTTLQHTGKVGHKSTLLAEHH